METKPKRVELTSRDLKDLVTPVLPLAAKGDGLPLLEAVLIRSAGEHLTATATDRYRLGIKRVKVSPKPPAGVSAVVSTATLRSILNMFKPTRLNNPELVLEFTADSVRIKAGGGIGGFLDAAVTWPLVEGDYPPVDRLISKAFAAEPVDSPTALNPSYLGDFRHAQTGGEPLVFRPGKDLVAVAVGDDFVGAMSTIRFGGGTEFGLDDWSSILPAHMPEPEAVAS